MSWGRQPFDLPSPGLRLPSPPCGGEGRVEGLRLEHKDSLHRPGANRTRCRTVGQAVDVIGERHVELELIRQAAIEIALVDDGHRTRRQDARDLTFPVRIGHERVLAAVLRTEWTKAEGVVQRTIETRGIEDSDPTSVLTIRDQPGQMDDDVRTLIDALDRCLSLDIGPFTERQMMTVRRKDRA